MKQDLLFSKEPENKEEFTKRFDEFYTKFGRLYDALVKIFPIWKHWISRTLPHIEGRQVLEVSFGTGYLLTRFANQFETYGVDLNERMVNIARKNLKKRGFSAELYQANIESLPFENETFDTIVNTMAFSGYPDGNKAMSEIRRVFKMRGRLIIIDINYPQNGNWVGKILINLWILSGDLVRDMKTLFEKFTFDFTDEEIGGFGTIHKYVAIKR